MTFYPIDKPTEPGWWWFRDDCDGRSINCIYVRRELGNDLTCELGNGSGGGVDKVAKWGQWYGPKLKTPAECAKSSGNLPSGQNGRDVPRRFRCRRNGVDGERCGVWNPGNDSYTVFDPGGTHAALGSDAISQCAQGQMPSTWAITEWLDPEPEAKRDFYDRLFDYLVDYLVGVKPVHGGVTREQLIGELRAAIPKLREKVPLP